MCAKPRGTTTSSAEKQKASRIARTTPVFSNSPPTSAIFGTGSFPLLMLLLKLRATASHSPLRISSGEYPFCWAWIMSLLANTEHRPAILAALAAWATISPTCSTCSFIRWACWSMNDPVPAAQSPFVS
jgi:hypothetical protein